MSNQLHAIADLREGQERLTREQEQLSQRVEALEANARELAAVISRELEITRRELIEGFTFKFIQSLDGPTDYIKRRVEGNCRQLELAEQQTADLEQKVRACRAEISGLLDEAAGRLAGTFESHHARNQASIETFADKTDAINAAVVKVAEAVRLCATFKRDYETTVTLAKYSMQYTNNTLDDVLVRLRGAVKGIDQKAQALDARRTRHTLFIAGAFVVGLLVGVLIMLLLK